MDLRKTIAGAAIALGSATLMLGLGGTANAAAGADAGTTPNLDLELGKVGNVGNLASIDTDNPAGKIEAINFDAVSAEALVDNVDAQAVDTLLGLSEHEGPSEASAGLGIG